MSKPATIPIKSAWKTLHSYPPALVRLYARRRTSGRAVRALTLPEIAITSGLPLRRVQVISKMTDWNTVTIFEAERYCAGCNFDPLSAADRNRQNAYRRSCSNQPFRYLKDSENWARELRPLRDKLARFQLLKRAS